MPHLRPHRKVSEDSSSDYELPDSDSQNDRKRKGESSRDGSEKRSRSNASDTRTILADRKSERLDEVARSFIRAILGLENRYQVLNRNFIAKLMDAENEKGAGIQFKRDLLPLIQNYLNDIFGLDLIPLPPDDYILVNVLPRKVKDCIYVFLKTYSCKISELADIDISDTNGGNFTGAMVKPAVEYVRRGFRMLILATILLHGNNISQTDLLNVLKDNFHLQFKEMKPIDVIGGITITEFLAEMIKQEYLCILTQPDSEKESSHGHSNNTRGKSRRTAGSNGADNSLLIYGLGRRAVTEFAPKDFKDFFKIIYGSWDDAKEEAASFTFKNVWPKPEVRN